MQIQIKNLIKNYETYKRGHTFKETVKSLFKREKVEVKAVKNISLDISQGELVGYIGPNGAGKSTTLKILTGILYPTSGEVSVLGYTPWKERKKYVQHIGAVFGQKSQLIWDIPPIDAFYMNQAIYGIDKKVFKERLNDLSQMLGVGELMMKPTRQLSLGERMKCEFIMAMLHDPKIVFLDEPTIGLDVIAKEKIREFIKEQNEKGVTFILTTHDLDDIENLAKRVIVINHGESVFDGNMAALKNHLGQKKIVHLSAHSPIEEIDLNGLSVIKKISSYEMELELDTGKTPLNQFIKLINSQSNIKDMSIEELPIEAVIKMLYQK